MTLTGAELRSRTVRFTFDRVTLVPREEAGVPGEACIMKSTK